MVKNQLKSFTKFQYNSSCPEIYQAEGFEGVLLNKEGVADSDQKMIYKEYL